MPNTFRQSKLTRSQWESAVKQLVSDGALPSMATLRTALKIGGMDSIKRVYTTIASAMAKSIGEGWLGDTPRRSMLCPLIPRDLAKKRRNNKQLYAKCIKIGFFDYVAVVICCVTKSCNRWLITDYRLVVLRGDRSEDTVKKSVEDFITQYYGQCFQTFVVLEENELLNKEYSLEKYFKNENDKKKRKRFKFCHYLESEKLRAINGINNAMDGIIKNLHADLITAELARGDSRQRPTDTLDFYVNFCVTKHMFRYRKAKYNLDDSDMAEHIIENLAKTMGFWGQPKMSKPQLPDVDSLEFYKNIIKRAFDKVPRKAIAAFPSHKVEAGPQ